MNSGHRERVRDQFNTDGIRNMKDYHILEFLLFYAIPRRDTKPIAHHLIDTFGSLSGVLDAEYEDLLRVDGIKEQSATFLKFIPAVLEFYLNEKMENKESIENISDLASILIVKYLNIKVETCMLTSLNDKNQILSIDTISEGTSIATEITPRKIVEIAIRTGATQVVLSHNHPASEPLPSNADMMTTDSIRHSLQQVGIRLRDHLIISGSKYVSCAEGGFLKDYTSF